MTFDLTAFFEPRSVAVVGASENPGKLGFHVMRSLCEGKFPGPIIPVNPSTPAVLGIPAHSSLSSCPAPVDLAVVVVPAGSVPAVFEECRGKGVRGIVLITAGFKEIDDPDGARRQEGLAGLARQAGIPVIGPNTFGLVNLHARLNATFTPEFSLAPRGGVSLVSQSGGISHLLAFRAMEQGVGLAKIVGLGNRLNVDFADLLHYLAHDPATRAVALYLEGLDDPRRLMEAALALRARKPVVAYKTGRAVAGDQASLSHTGTLAGRSEVYDGAFRQAGILPVDSTQRLLDAAKALSLCPLPAGPRVAILTGQAGPGMAACDVCEAEGLEVPFFSPATQLAINELLPPLAMRSNPVDMGPAWYDSRAIEGIVRAVAADPGIDGILLLMMFASANREALPNLVPFLTGWRQRKPLIGCLVAPPGVWDPHVRRLEEAAALVHLPTPERAARAMASLLACSQLTPEARRTPWTS